MAQKAAKWIWQHPDYPNFVYDEGILAPLISKIDYQRGVLDGIAKLFMQQELEKIEIDVLTDEAVHTSLIEGEVFQRESVRSSFRKKLDKDFENSGDNKYSTAVTDSLAAVLLDCSLNKEPLSVERLHGWHNALFENSYSRLEKIRIAQFREQDNMEVVSGAIGFEKVHYKAVPASKIEEDIERFLDYCQNSADNLYIKSAIAHLWFVSIHPYDDGNGRIARAITDYILSGSAKATRFKLYSISAAINKDRKGYYEILDRTTNLFINRNFDITPWLVWHLNTLQNALTDALQNIEYLVQKTKFWDAHRLQPLNERQIKVLNKLLDKGAQNFEGGLSTKKYIAMTKVSKATAVRDIAQLMSFGCIRQIEGTGGRNIRYMIDFSTS